MESLRRLCQTKIISFPMSRGRTFSIYPGLNFASILRTPQSDGQTERVNQCLGAQLRCAFHSCPVNWSHRLPLAGYGYNTSYHTFLGMTPFEVLYGYHPHDFGVISLSDSEVPDLTSSFLLNQQGSPLPIFFCFSIKGKNTR